MVSPKPIDRSLTASEGVQGPVIEINHITRGNSGRYDIADVIARVFPAYRSHAVAILKDFDFPLALRPFPTDVLTYRSKTVVEYTTPARADGLGTMNSWLKRNDSPISGVAILIGNPPDMLLLSVRLPPEVAPLKPAIVRGVERSAAEYRRR